MIGVKCLDSFPHYSFIIIDMFPQTFWFEQNGIDIFQEKTVLVCVFPGSCGPWGRSQADLVPSSILQRALLLGCSSRVEFLIQSWGGVPQGCLD